MRDTLRDTVHDGERGGVLLAALIVTLMATALLIGAGHEVGVRLESGRLLRRARLALAGAEAGMEAAARLASASGYLRGAGSTNPHWIQSRAIGAATVSVDASDPADGLLEANGALGSSDADTVRLTAAAQVGGLQRLLQSDWLPQPHLALRNAVFSRRAISIGSVRIEGRVRGNGDIGDAGSASVFGDITTLTGSAIAVSLDDGDTDIYFAADSVSLPAINTTWFIEAGQKITLPAMPAIQSTTITPTHNPYGNPSPSGIYWIDAGGGNVVLSGLAVVACLVIVNARTVYVCDLYGYTTDYYHASPDPGRLPALIVRGNLDMRIEGGHTWTLSIGGETRTVSSGLDGVFYCTGTFTGPQQDAGTAIRVDGAILANQVVLVGPSTLIRHAPRLNTVPLAQLTRPGLRLLAESVREP